jgi:hypothetical protein
MPEKGKIHLKHCAAVLASFLEAKFWDVIGKKVFRVFLLAIHSHLY